MSWNIRHYYALLYLKGVPDQRQLDRIITDSVESLRAELQTSALLQDRLSDLDIDYDLDDKSLSEYLDGIVRSFIKQVEFADDHTYVLIESEYDSGNSCDELVDYLAELLFPYSVDPYVLLCSASLDRYGGYSHQSMLCTHGGQLVKMSTIQVLSALFKQPVPHLNQILSAIQEV